MNDTDKPKADYVINNDPTSVFADYLLDPVGNNNRLKQLKLDTARICELDRPVPYSLFSFRLRRSFCFSFDECQRMTSNREKALHMLLSLWKTALGGTL